MKTTLLSLTAALSTPFAATAATALIDFGTPNAPSPYNTANILAAGANATTGAITLTDTASNPTGWTVSVLNTGSGQGGNAGAGANATVFPTSISAYATEALQDSIYANQGGGTTPSMVLTFTGLNPAASYDLILYGSRKNAQGADQRWSLTQGSGGADVTHFSEDNQTTVVDWPGISPDGSGVIEILIDSPGPDNIGALALNFGSITEVIPEPSATLLCALSMLALVARRRR